MPRFHGIDHVALTVTDLDRSERFWTQVFGLLPVIDIGHGRVLMDTRSGFTVALLQHADGRGERFSELVTGLDHLGLAAQSRDELVEWEGRLRAAGAEVSPIVDTDLGHHLSFKDPDGIALELSAPTEVYAAAMAQLRSREMSDAEVLAAAEQLLGPDLVPSRAPDASLTRPHETGVSSASSPRS